MIDGKVIAVSAAWRAETLEELFDWRWLHMHKPSEGVEIENVTADFGTWLNCKWLASAIFQGMITYPTERVPAGQSSTQRGPAGSGYAPGG